MVNVMSMKEEVINKMSALMTAAFGLVAALAWNEAIKALFDEGGRLHFLAAYGVWLYAILVTLFAVLVTIWIGRIAEKLKGKKKDDIET
jgi:MFS-type transporter involved in bile tolerance (Atg22 family)